MADFSTPGEETGLLVLGALQNPGHVVNLEPQQLDLTLRVLRRARLLGRLGWVLRERGVLMSLPQAAVDQLQGALAIVEARERIARWEMTRLEAALPVDAADPIVALKGCAYLLANLPNARGRVFADVDLLVAEDRLGHVEDRLRSRGWASAPMTPYDERYYRRWTHELPPLSHPEREVEVDLHHNILMRTARLRPDAGSLLARSRQVASSRFRVLDPVDMVLHSMTHLFHGGEMDDALRELVDVDVLLRHFAAIEADFWSRLWPRAMAIDLARPTYYGLRYTSRLLGSPVPTEVLRASDEAAPPAAVVALMDRLVPRALFPPHPDAPARLVAASRWLLYVRAHWVKMPPWLLAPHLSYKFYRRYFRPAVPRAAA